MKNKKIIFLSAITIFSLLATTLISSISAQPTNNNIAVDKSLSDPDPCELLRDIYNDLVTKIENLRNDGYTVLADLLTGMKAFLEIAVELCDKMFPPGGFRSTLECALCAS